MKKLTDEAVARALGWKRVLVCCGHTTEKKFHWAHPSWKKDGDWLGTIPPFTTSLDAIVAEVETRRLRWACEGFPDNDGFFAWVQGKRSEREIRDGQFYRGGTAPLALCTALLAYLKEGA